MKEKIIQKCKHYIYILKRIDIFKFIYWNFISNCVIREEKCYIFTMKNSVLDIDKSARIILSGNNITIGHNKLRKSKAETYLRMEKNSKWISKGGAKLFYDTVLELKNNAIFEAGYFTVNGGSTIIVAQNIIFGDNVMLGRNILVYDSDHHQVLDAEGRMTNPPQKVVIEDNVWLTSNVTVLKGVHIGQGSLVTAQTLVRKDVPHNSVAGGGATAKIISNHASWSRKSTNI
ncbi:acyltransferase [Sedimentibacter sp. MB31-C6]|uniref:acyltransferase n=1 Tax=Sedimentibacter sp. MB31-C6 TaxID=3109366 RepID=UPI002DDD704A|nr:acyltransferase [Sedimentibacter sp. MB36-C1]WSI04966.1 acyltransferase [Sedimentibacter sp. MB36-C1]